MEHSTDGLDFRPVTRVYSNGNSNIDQHYSYEHQIFTPGEHIYRLWQYDLDGTYTNLGLTSLKREGTFATTLFPNPVIKGQFFQLLGPSANQDQLQCTLHNLIGQSWLLERTDDQYSLPNNLPSGMYLVRLANGSNITTLPLQVQ